MPSVTAAVPSVADYAVLMNGVPLSAKHKSHIAAITVDLHTRWPGMFEIVMAGSHYLTTETEWIDDTDIFAPGNEVEIKMGYVDRLQTAIIGEITGIEPEFATHSLPRCIVRGYDRGHRLHRNRKTRTFTQQKDSDIASLIASNVGLTGEVTDSQVTHDYVCQAQQTDMEFLMERARRINYEVVVDAKKLLFRPVQNTGSEVVTLTMQDDLLEFLPRLSTMGQRTEINVRGWNPKEKQEIIGKGATGDESSTMGGNASGAQLASGAFGDATVVIGGEPVATQAEADQIAKAYFNDAALSLISGEGTSRGRTDIAAGKVIKIDGVGTRFSGNYYLTAASHQYNSSKNFLTRFNFRRSGS